jgi:hypothetical protein
VKPTVNDWLEQARAAGDPGEMKRCLEAWRRAADAASDVDDLCAVGRATAELLNDTHAAEAILGSAERLVGADVGKAAPVALAWNALGRRERATEVLEAAMKHTASCAEALLVARTLSTLGVSSGVRRALRQAADVAETAEAWLSVAETAFDTKQKSFVRDALVMAGAVASDDEVQRVAAGFVRWIRDGETADRLDRGRPEGLRVPVRRLEGWEGSASGLLDWLRTRVPRDALEAMAQADYGWKAKESLASLADICATGIVPRRPESHVREVLELTRWASGDRVDHLTRAFACALICLWDDIDGLASTAAILVESCLALGAEASALAAQLFTWRCETEDPEEDHDDGIQPVPLLALVVLAVAADPLDARIAPLVRTVEENPWCSPAVLAGILDDTVRADLWRELFDRVLVPARSRNPAIGVLVDRIRPGSGG